MVSNERYLKYNVDVAVIKYANNLRNFETNFSHLYPYFELKPSRTNSRSPSIPKS